VRTSVFVGTSLDGFIARTDGGMDWMSAGGGQDSGADHGYEAFIATVDALVIGRKTYETVLGFGKWPYGERLVFVLSTRELAPAPEGARVERMSGSPDEIVSRLEARGVEHAYVDGGITIQEFLRAGLIQRIIVSRLPVLIGSGIPLFGATDADIALEHVVTRVYAKGLVQSEYAVRGRVNG
jgi:dihydrofolate reductase